MPADPAAPSGIGVEPGSGTAEVGAAPGADGTVLDDGWTDGWTDGSVIAGGVADPAVVTAGLTGAAVDPGAGLASPPIALLQPATATATAMTRGKQFRFTIRRYQQGAEAARVATERGWL